MADFKNIMNDFTHLVFGMSSVAGGMKSEMEMHIQSLFNTCAMQAGFVRRDEFDALTERFENATETIKKLEAEIISLKKV